jgi:hypothetical protein
LAERIARQLVFKFDAAALGDRSSWRALGDLLRRDAERLETRLGLVERQVVVALPCKTSSPSPRSGSTARSTRRVACGS